ncbi:MAG: Arsenical resistance operon repressor [uncultured Chloroflexi bacterium]|uniref:Arsenical resistance operon repressor n=1 Tax=uncultured Chloroflexota bacterium TaxID=166587 RepID=A0A6J4J3E7_9CHLR|nr:MAG: Arsenical resistance operon repressor [uncultured Chloroflexota bacterium]
MIYLGSTLFTMVTTTAERTGARPDPLQALQATDGAGCCAPAVVSPLPQEDALRQAAVFKALSDPTRLRMLALIAAQPASEPLCACDVESGFDLSQPTISHHLKVLREAGLVTVTKQGLWHYYAPAPGGLALARGALNTLGAGPTLS